MPEELRQRLVDAAARSGRSLNSELVHRLESSLDAEAGSRYSARIRRSMRSSSTRGERSMHRRRTRRRLILAGVVAALATAAGVTAVALGPSSPQAVPAGGEMSAALGQHLAQLRQAVPG